MYTFPKLIATSLCVCGLAACGGSSSDPTAPLVLPAAVISGTVPVTYDPTTGAINLDGAELVNPQSTVLATNGDATLYLSDIPAHRSAIAENVDVYAAAVVTDGLASETTAGTFARRGETEMPSGSATFTGDYAGILVEDPFGGAHAAFALLTGDVSLSMDFENAMLSGDITNRDVLFVSGVDNVLLNSADVAIGAGVIDDDGTFTALTDGGGLNPVIGLDTWESEFGSVNGVIGGATGESVAGIVRIGHERVGSVDTYEEIGSFVAGRD